MAPLDDGIYGKMETNEGYTLAWQARQTWRLSQILCRPNEMLTPGMDWVSMAYSLISCRHQLRQIARWHENEHIIQLARRALQVDEGYQDQPIGANENAPQGFYPNHISDNDEVPGARPKLRLVEDGDTE